MTKNKKDRQPPTEGQQMAALMGGYFGGILLFIAGAAYLISQAPV